MSLEKQEMTSDSAKNHLFQLFSCISLNFLHVLVHLSGFVNIMRLVELDLFCEVFALLSFCLLHMQQL